MPFPLILVSHLNWGAGLSATALRFFSRLLDNLSDGGLLYLPTVVGTEVLAVSSRPGTQHAARPDGNGCYLA